MILWILALILMGALGLVGYYQGALRATVSFVGLIVAALLAIPLSPIVKPLLRIFGFEHPVILAFIAPLIIYLIILAGSKGGALVLHKKLDTYFKYKASDTERMLFERMNSRVGACVGVANAFVYLILISIVGYTLGYFTTQVSTPESAAFSVKMANMFADDLQSTKTSKAIAGFLPASDVYYDSCDVAGDLYHNPLLQSRLASYPVFLSLAEKPEFKELSKDTKFQEQFWLKTPRPTLNEFLNHEKLGPIVKSVDVYTNILGMLGHDLKDLKTFVESGKSPKYEGEKLYGHWYYDFPATFKRARRAKLNMAPIEIKVVRATLGQFTNSVMTVYVDNRLVWKVPQTNSPAPIVVQGTWKSDIPEKYEFTFKEPGKNQAGEASGTIDGSKLTIKRDKFALVFER